MNTLDNKVIITVQSGGRIPFINTNGPIFTPIAVEERIANSLIANGYKITILNKINKNNQKKNIEVKKEETPIDTKIVEDVKVDTTVTETKEQIKVETVQEEVKNEEQEIKEKVVETSETTEQSTEEVPTTEEPVAESTTNESVVDEKNTIYTEEDLKDLDRIALRKILRSRGIIVKKHQTMDELKENIINSNPQ